MRPGRPSQTALGVALGWSWVARHRSLAGLAPPSELELTERLLEHVPRRVRRARRLLRCGAFSRVMHWLSERLGPGIALHMVLRKRWFADTVRAELTAGRSQLVALGAGFDALAACIACERPDVECFELDHPDTQEWKHRALVATGPVPENLHLIPADLASGDPSRILRGHAGFRPEAESVFVAEALLMYLERRRVSGLLGGLPAAPGGVLLYSYLVGDAEERPEMGRGAAFLRWKLRRTGEPLLWGLPPGREAELLRGTGWQLDRSIGAAELRELYPVTPDAVLMDWERLAVARLPGFP